MMILQALQIESIARWTPRLPVDFDRCQVIRQKMPAKKRNTIGFSLIEHPSQLHFLIQA
jgi:hypothetical protein